MSSLGKIHATAGQPRPLKAQIAAKYAGKELDFNTELVFGKTNKSPEYLAKFPFGKVPALDSVDGPLYESSAIAYYAAAHKPELVGKTPYEAALVCQYIGVADNEIGGPTAAWVYPMLGYAPYNEAASKKAEADITKVLTILDEILLSRTFLVGESITLADIVVFCSVLALFKMYVNPDMRKKFVNLTRWFVTCANQPNFHSVTGDILLCENTSVYDPAKAIAASEAAAKAAAASHEDGDDEEAAPQPKVKNPLDLLPPTAFNLEDWKRFYSNNETRPTAIDHFWANYDTNGYSIWRINYRYNEELTQIFMTCNLVGGLFQRMDRLRKYAFGNVIIFGEDNKSEISGIFVFRGAEIPPEMKEVADYDSYDFIKLDPTDAVARELFNDYLAWDGKLEGKTLNQAKTFK